MLIWFVVLYLLVSIGIGLFAATRVHSAKDFAVAGRHLPLPVVTATVFATWFGAEAVFGVSALDWYPVFSLRPHPSFILPRSDLEIVERGRPTDGEEYSLLPDAQVIVCRYDVHRGSPKTIRLALDAEALSGFSSWLESAPPGANHTMGRFT